MPSATPSAKKARTRPVRRVARRAPVCSDIVNLLVWLAASSDEAEPRAEKNCAECGVQQQIGCSRAGQSAALAAAACSLRERDDEPEVRGRELGGVGGRRVER